MSRIGIDSCNCVAIRKAARRVTQAYDAQLADAGIRVTQFMILMALQGEDGVSINDLAETMAMDRTTMGKNLRPLERDGLVDVKVSETDRRSRDIVLTRKGRALLERAYPLWRRAHQEFQDKHGAEFAKSLRTMLGEVSAQG